MSEPSPAHPGPVTRLRVLLWHGRRPLRALAIAVVVLSAARVAAPPPVPSAPVVVAARTVPAGTALAPADVRVVRVPHALVPQGAPSRVDDVLGRTTVHPLARGLALTPDAVGDGRFDVAPPEGHVVTAVRLGPGPDGDVLRAGDVVEVLAARPGGDAQGRPVADVVAREALVLGVRTGQTEAGLLGAGAEPDPVTLLALTPEDGRRLAAVLGSAQLTALLLP